MSSFHKILILIWLLSPIYLLAQTDKDSITQVFQLGEVVLQTSPQKNQVKTDDIIRFNKKDAAETLDLIPSVSMNTVGGRNESSVYLRGFDIRSIPIYMDGIPIYVPYDGYADLSRFTTADLAKIEVSKGYSSILYGPNALGGTINLISSKPLGLFELKTKAGLLSGAGFNNYVNIGTRQKKWYLQSIFSQYDRQFVPLSQDFETSPKEEDFERDNSYRKDRKFTTKIGFTPNDKDEYSLSFIKQMGEKGNPIYLGNDPLNKIRYWQWPYWNKESIYFISKTQMGSQTLLKSRVFYDTYRNKLKSFDNADYNTQTTNKAFTSFYDDVAYGANLESATEYPKHTFKSAFHYKRDNHQSHNEGQKPEHIKDDTYSLGIEDIWQEGKKWQFIPGISYHFRKSILAENAKITNVDGSYAEFPKNDNQAFNVQWATLYQWNEKWKFNTSVSYKTRFATMKDRYSYKLGTALPNPDLKSEKAFNIDLGTEFTVEKLSIKPEFFYSKIFNTIQLVNNVEPGISQMQNTGTAQFYGADFSLTYRPLSYLNLLLNYAFIQRENISQPEVLFTDVPEHHLIAMMEVKPLKNLNFNVNTHYNSVRYSTSYGIKAPEFVVFHSQLAYDFKNGIRLETGINNIFDRNYALSEGYPEAGRNYYLNLYYQFIQK